jgi:hypothetical protein
MPATKCFYFLPMIPSPGKATSLYGSGTVAIFPMAATSDNVWERVESQSFPQDRLIMAA